MYLGEALRARDRVFLDEGADSQVFLAGMHVVKEYRPEISYKHALSYQAVTEAAISHLNRNPHSGEIKVDGTTFPFDLAIHPINHVVWDDAQRKAKAVSEYVPGPRVLDFIEPREKVVEQVVGSIPDPREARFFEGLLARVLIGEPVLDMGNEWWNLRQFTDNTGKSLGVNGLHLTPQNVKVRLKPEHRSLSFIVTDLCSSLLSLGLKRA